MRYSLDCLITSLAPRQRVINAAVMLVNGLLAAARSRYFGGD